MGKVKNTLIFFLFLFTSIVSSGQVDDSITEGSSLQGETIAKNLYLEAQLLLDSGNFEESLEAFDRALVECEKEGLLMFVAQILLYKGIIYRIEGDYPQSLKNLFLSLDLYNTLGSVGGKASAYIQIGSIYRLQGNYSGAIEHYLSSLKHYQMDNDTIGESSALNNIGIVYFYQKNYEKALEYYKASLSIEEALKNDYGISVSYINIGEVYKNMGNYQQALDYFLKALVLAKKNKDLDRDGDSVGILYNEIGSIYTQLGDYSLSQSYLQRAFKIFSDIESKQRIAECEIYMGELALKQDRLNDAKSHFLNALKNANEISALDLISNANLKLSDIFDINGNPSMALHYYKQHIAARDSIFNEDNTKRMVQAEMLYQFEKEMQEAKLEQTRKDLQVQEIANRQKLFRNFLVLLLVMLLVIVISIYTAYKNKREANINLAAQQEEILEKNEELLQQQEEILSQRDEIEKKNQILENSQLIIEAKNERIISSIEYAQTIQQAILPNKEQLSKLFPNHTVLFLPKDIVSGDFYWISELDNLLFAAVIDCTGHGVPGAFMSLIGNTMLNQIVNEWQTRDPGLILELMHKQVRRALNQDNPSGKAHASMDVCLVSIDKKRKLATFAGASRPLYIIQNGKVEKIPGDPRSVGGYQREGEKRYFTDHNIDLTKSPSLYLTTDGYMDQMDDSFKKFGHNRFNNLLIDIHNESAERQSELLLTAFEEHRNGHEQIDDICVLGLKV